MRKTLLLRLCLGVRLAVLHLTVLRLAVLLLAILLLAVLLLAILLLRRGLVLLQTAADKPQGHSAGTVTTRWCQDPLQSTLYLDDTSSPPVGTGAAACTVVPYSAYRCSHRPCAVQGCVAKLPRFCAADVVELSGLGWALRRRRLPEGE